MVDIRKTACHFRPCAYKPVALFGDVASESMPFFPPKEQWQALEGELLNEPQHRRPCPLQIQQASVSKTAAGLHDL